MKTTFTAYEVLKTGNFYTLLIKRSDGTTNDYRFKTKTEINRWLKNAGLL